MTVDEAAAIDPTTADLTRERLIRSAAAILSRRGYGEARLQDIAAAADLKAPAVYYHFASRDALISAALREGQILVRRQVLARLAALGPDASDQDRIAAAIEVHLRLELDESDLAGAVVRTASHVPAQVRAEIDAEVAAYYSVWRDLLAEAHAHGVLRPGLNLSVVRMLVLGLLNWSIEWRTPETPVEAVVANAQALIGRALFADQ